MDSVLCCSCARSCAGDGEHTRNPYLRPAQEETAKFVAGIWLDIQVVLTTQLVLSSALEELRVAQVLLGRIHFLLGKTLITALRRQERRISLDLTSSSLLIFISSHF